MNKKYFGLLLLLFYYFEASGQNNRISTTISYFFAFNNKINTGDTTASEVAKAFQILPAIGYYRVIKNNIGVGLELGYRNSNYKVTDNFNYPNNSYTRKIENSLPYRSYYLCPSVFENYYLNKYQLITSLIIPFEYVTKREQYYNTFLTDRNTHEVFYEAYSTIKWPKILQYGIYFNTGFYRKIYKGLYIGTELGIGLACESRFGNGTSTYKQVDNGVITYNESNTDHYKKYSNAILDMRPTFSLHYNF